jgi:hypothetical protein
MQTTAKNMATIKMKIKFVPNKQKRNHFDFRLKRERNEKRTKLDQTRGLRWLARSLLNQMFRKRDMLVVCFFDRSLCALRENSRPFLFLFLFPETLFSFPVGHAITPKVEIDIKLGRDHTTKTIHMKPNLLAGNRETKVVCAQELDMETSSTTTQTRLEGQRDRVLGQLKQVSAKSGQQEERSIRRGRGMMHQGTKTTIHLFFERTTMGEIQLISKV